MVGFGRRRHESLELVGDPVEDRKPEDSERDPAGDRGAL
jgi:hypothetical protein